MGVIGLHSVSTSQRAAMEGQLDKCTLLLQQGAGIDINTPSKLGSWAVLRLFVGVGVTA